MPRTLFDDEGNPVEVPTEEELNTLKSAQTQLTEMQTKLGEFKEALGSDDPSIRGMREQIKKLSNVVKGKQADPAAPAKPDAAQQLTAEEVARIADERYIGRYRDHVLSRFGDKADKVRGLFEKLASGEQLTEARVDEYMDIAARAAGVVQSATPDQRATAFRGSTAPSFTPPSDDQNFGDTDQGKNLANAMGIIIDKPKA